LTEVISKKTKVYILAIEEIYPRDLVAENKKIINSDRKVEKEVLGIELRRFT